MSLLIVKPGTDLHFFLVHGNLISKHDKRAFNQGRNMRNASLFLRAATTASKNSKLNLKKSKEEIILKF